MGEILDAGESLRETPLAGKPLRDELTGLLSLRVERDRFRIVYQVDEAAGRVIVLLVGARRAGQATDVYAIARRLLAAGLLGD
jgi:mRNA-degrading endonuclease RelE of RelBE toxin-antitoxin system